MQKFLFSKIDNSPLIIFRILFGLLITLESWGAIATGWVLRVLIEPQFTFNFIGFEFLQPLPGNGMYYYFFLMGLCGIAVMLGFRYRIAIVSFTILWAGAYLMQKSSYNNHYYLLFLLNIIMCFLPAHKNLSFDVKHNYTQKTDWMPSWVKWLIVTQLFIVYTYASVAKFYPDWLDTTVAANLMRSKKDFFLIGSIVQQKWAHYVIAYFGIIFDGLIIPALLYKRTRKIAFLLAIFFHLYNSFVLHIGIFPYLALAFCVFFFEPKVIRKLFYSKTKKEITDTNESFQPKSWIIISIGIWLLIQTLLPLRHWFIPGDVLRTEEGHRLSWRMMLRSKGGSNTFFVKEKKDENSPLKRIDLRAYLTKKQIRSMGGKPDLIWQFAQHLKKTYKSQGKDIEVYVKNRLRVNGKKQQPLIDFSTDLASVEWDYFKHNYWIVIEE